MIETASVRAFLDERHVTLAARVGEFADRLIAPLAEPRDDKAAREQARDFVAKLGAAGWFEPIRNQDWRACCVVREALAAASPLADAVFALQALGVVPMLLAPNDAMRKRWLDAAIQGRAMASFAMTEPNAGSDAATRGSAGAPCAVRVCRTGRRSTRALCRASLDPWWRKRYRSAQSRHSR